MLESFTLAPGFRATATACGLKTSSAMAASSCATASALSRQHGETWSRAQSSAAVKSPTRISSSRR